MKREARDRLLLSLVAEPDDAALRTLVAEHGIEAVAAACRGEQVARVQAHDVWRERALQLDLAALVSLGTGSAVRWLVPESTGWPAAVADLGGLDGSAPWGLWVAGRDELADVVARSVAVVGARSATTYGAELAAELAADLADRRWGVVSGAAFGIDASAHRGALAVGGRTVAVLACGVDVVYPRAHSALIDRIAAEGLIVSEYPPGAPPRPHRFLARNRIIAALTGGTVVVEAARRSGSLNTLHWADQLGRVTMGVPGPVVSQQSVGVHRALRAGEAVLVTNVDDVEEEMVSVGWRSTAASAEVTESAARIRDVLDPARQQSVDELARLIGRPLSTVRNDLQLLEHRGWAARGGGGWLGTQRTINVPPSTDTI